MEISGRITVTGDVHLILADDCTLTAPNGISVTSGNRLTIYARSVGDGAGALVAGSAITIGNGYAGIGGEYGNIKVYAHGDITINGGNITAQGSDWAAGIGGGSGVYSKTEENGTITINGGTVNATGGEKAAGIGSGYDAKVNRSVGAIKINTAKGSTDVTATGGAGAAGIGSSYEGTLTSSIQIAGNAKVEATGGDADKENGAQTAGAGIGSGGGFVSASAVGKITITGGTITATGGTGEELTTGKPETSFRGAGIGSGGSYVSKSTTNDIVINAGTITATGGAGADGIGSGAGNSESGDFSTDRTNTNDDVIPGKAVIRTNSITDDDVTEDWNAVVFEGTEGTVYGDVTLGKGLTVKKTETLTVPASTSLSVPTGKKLTVNGELTNEGTLTNQGTLDNKGTLTNEGTLDNKGTLTNEGTLDNNGTIANSGTLDGTAPTGTPPVNNPEASYTNADGTTTFYTTIGDAIRATNAGSGGGTVKLLKDATLYGIDKATPSYSEEISLTYIRKPSHLTWAATL